jgi:hypothetical protein
VVMRGWLIFACCFAIVVFMVGLFILRGQQ